MDDKDLLIEKMETKICQLTRVVFHLNNKYLDSQATIESIALSYDKEIENIVRESNLAIKKYETSKTSAKFSFNVEKTGHYKTCFKSLDNEIFGEKNYIIFDLNTESNLDVIHNNNETAVFKDMEKVKN